METILEQVSKEGVVCISLNRPEYLNALNDRMAHELRDVLNRLSKDSAVRCLVIQGMGEHFMAGGDIAYFKQSTKLPNGERKQQVYDLVGVVHDSIHLLRKMDKPVIASVQGSVAGFGMSLMMACDLALAADDATFVQAYSQIATTPDGGNTFHLPRMVGMKQAMAMTLLNTPLNAQQALGMGLVNQIVPVGQLQQVVEKTAHQLARGPVQAMARAKQLINQSFDNTLQQQLDAEQQSFTQSALSGDFEEGVTAFLEKRRPQFKGD